MLLNSTSLKHYRVALTCTSLALLVGCASPHSKVASEYGKSVRAMIAGQIYDTEAAAFPSQDPPLGQDATKATADINRVYRRSDITKETIKAIASPFTGGS